jgi:hypothetical protein
MPSWHDDEAQTREHLLALVFPRAYVSALLAGALDRAEAARSPCACSRCSASTSSCRTISTGERWGEEDG